MCAYAVNTGTGGGNSLLGCRTVSPASGRPPPGFPGSSSRAVDQRATNQLAGSRSASTLDGVGPGRVTVDWRVQRLGVPRGSASSGSASSGWLLQRLASSGSALAGTGSQSAPAPPPPPARQARLAVVRRSSAAQPTGNGKSAGDRAPATIEASRSGLEPLAVSGSGPRPGRRPACRPRAARCGKR